MTQPVDGSSAAAPAPETVTTIRGCRLIPNFLDRGRADALLEFLLSAVVWQTEDIVLFGRRRRVPRLVAWFGDEGLCYRYSGADHATRGWPAELLPLRDAVARELSGAPNFVLLNRYRSGRDAMGWHTDDEAMVSDLIGSLSLGAARRFLVRPVPGEASRALELTHGSLLVMDRHLPHCLPRTRREVAERINLSFRTVP